MAVFMDLPLEAQIPKRGDLVHTNVGNKRERTWLILRARRMRRRCEASPRYALFIARWWELEPDMRMRLYASATRNGGQNVFWFKRYPPKKKRKLLQWP